MASGANIIVSVESAAHKALRDLAVEIYEKYEIRITSVHFDWNNLLSLKGSGTVLHGITMETRS